MTSIQARLSHAGPSRLQVHGSWRGPRLEAEGCTDDSKRTPDAGIQWFSVDSQVVYLGSGSERHFISLRVFCISVNAYCQVSVETVSRSGRGEN